MVDSLHVNSVASSVSVIPWTRLSRELVKHRWYPGRRIEAEPHFVKLRKAGYDIHRFAENILKEFVGIRFRYRRVQQCLGIEQHGDIKEIFTRPATGLIAISGRLWICGPRIPSESELVQQTFSKLDSEFGELVRIGWGLRKPYLDRSELDEENKRSVFYCDSKGAIIEMTNWHEGVDVYSFNNFGNFLACKLIQSNEFTIDRFEAVLKGYFPPRTVLWEKVSSVETRDEIGNLVSKLVSHLMIEYGDDEVEKAVEQLATKYRVVS